MDANLQLSIPTSGFGCANQSPCLVSFLGTQTYVGQDHERSARQQTLEPRRHSLNLNRRSTEIMRMPYSTPRFRIFCILCATRSILD